MAVSAAYRGGSGSDDGVNNFPRMRRPGYGKNWGEEGSHVGVQETPPSTSVDDDVSIEQYSDIGTEHMEYSPYFCLEDTLVNVG
uniref:Uncharacterized protein n=1 Tax=Oryza punctata TaxID=4537 RepID=A0A0E0LN62_ORYPU